MENGSFQVTRIAAARRGADAALADRLAILDSRPQLPPEVVDREAYIIAALQAQLRLERLAIFARTYETGDVLVALPLYARAELAVMLTSDVEGRDVTIGRATIPLGQVATDHVGYASFDLTILRTADALLGTVRHMEDADPETLRLSMRLWVLPFSDETLAIDAAKEGEGSGEALVLRLELDEQRLAGRALMPPMTSMQTPSILDWRLSPGSFAAAPGRLVGEAGCEDLYPANLSTYQFQFNQLVRRADARSEVLSPIIRNIRYGYLLEYRSEWYPVGHSLGQVIYSLPLAPGEKVNLAIIDWSRTDTASRAEATSLSEQLTHDQARDRTISEVVQATVTEHQSGSSGMFGLSSSVLAPVGGAFVGGALGLGAATTSSSGTREISADTTQKLSDGFHQASTAIRQLRSTVVTQAAQAEAGRFETRVVANHNHCHTLTILYYEVLRHYRVLTRLTRRRPVLFVDLSGDANISFTDEAAVLAYRAALEAALVDARHLAGFEALARKRSAEIAVAEALDRYAAGRAPGERAGWRFPRLLVSFRTGSNGTDGNVFVTAALQDGTSVRLRQVDPPDTGTTSPFFFGTDSRQDYVENSLDAYFAEPETPFEWADLRSFIVGLVRSPSRPFPTTDDWKLDAVRIIGFTDNNDAAVLLDTTIGQTLHLDQTIPELPAVRPTAPAGDAPKPLITDFVSSEDLARARLLIEHLTHFSAHYRAALLADGDAVRRAENFRPVDVGGITLLDAIENRPVGAVGFEVAFPLTSVGDAVIRHRIGLSDRDDAPTDLVVVEDLVGLPTRGVFGEAKLGYCSACETIDDTRFWDWQRSPIPEEAPAVAPVDTGSRFQAPGGLAATPFPASIVNIANPSPAPDPGGLAAALGVLGRGDLFRDMSGSAGLSQLLTSMTKGTTDAVSALAGSRRESELIDQISKLPGLDDKQKADLMGRVLGGGPSASDGSGTATKPSTETPAAPETPPAPAQPQQVKPSQPRPMPPGKLVVMVAVDLLGEVQTREVNGTMIVYPPQGDPVTVGPVPLVQGGLRAVFEKVSERSGTLKVDLSWGKYFYAPLPVPGMPPLVARGIVQIEGSIPFAAPPGRDVLIFQAKPAIRSIRKKATSAWSAEDKAKTEIGGNLVFKIEKIGLQIGGSGSGTNEDNDSTSGSEESEYIIWVVEPRLELTLQASS